MYVIPCNYGPQSIALIEWMHQHHYTDVHCLYVDTGWSAPGWSERVKKAEEWVKSLGFQAKTLYPKRNFEGLILEQKKFPTSKFQWCASFLKGLPILEYLDFELDPEMQATIVLALRRSAARSLGNLQEFIERSEHYNGRKIWHPLYVHSTAFVEELWRNSAFGSVSKDDPLGLDGGFAGRSLECVVCVNGSTADLARTKESFEEVAGRISSLEAAVSGVFPVEERGVIGESAAGGLEPFLKGCGLPFGCGL
jgi:hypothetical protein